jgi:transcriptional regulator with XRE-family HTH domain
MNNKESMKIGQSLKNARIKAGMTQIEMAKKCNLSQSYLSQIEAGARTPSLGVIKTVAKVTKTKPSKLID